MSKKDKDAIDMYQVKVTQKNNPKNVHFGTVDKFHDKAKALWKQNKIIITNPVYGDESVVDLNEFDVDDQGFGDWGQCDKETHMPNSTEFDRYILKEYKKHVKKDNAAGEGLKKHRMFRVGVADGYAHYVITKVGARNVEIEWRGFGLDDYCDQILGGGGSFPRHCIEPQVRFANAQKKLFG